MRTADQRAENVNRHPGTNVELYQKASHGMLEQIIGQEGNIRSNRDIKAVMIEQGITGTVIPMRPVLEPITRTEQVGYTFETPVATEEIKNDSEETE